MTEPAWQQARLIPTSGINGAQEQERRATSALLAVMSAVKEYGRSLTKALGAHAGEIETFIEVEFDLDGKKVIPDGLIRVSRGSRVWTCLVEVKTGRNDLQPDQLENYLEVAETQQHPGPAHDLQPDTGGYRCPSDKGRQTQAPPRRHASLRMERDSVPGRDEKEYRGVADPDQA